MADDDDRPSACYASPPCFMHELDPGGAWSPDRPDPRQIADVARWRKAERQRLLELRMTLSAAERDAKAELVAERLDELVGEVSGRVVSGYWPIRGELNLLGWMKRAAERGAICALPVVIEKARPLVFRRWRPGERLARGVWNIPVPPDGPEVVPDIMLAPVVGFDHSCYRLGYGGGYFDRTLARLNSNKRVIGVGYSNSQISTIYPQEHDIPLDLIVTEDSNIFKL